MFCNSFCSYKAFIHSYSLFWESIFLACYSMLLQNGETLCEAEWDLIELHGTVKWEPGLSRVLLGHKSQPITHPRRKKVKSFRFVWQILSNWQCAMAVMSGVCAGNRRLYCCSQQKDWSLVLTSGTMPSCIISKASNIPSRCCQSDYRKEKCHQIAPWLRPECSNGAFRQPLIRLLLSGAGAQFGSLVSQAKCTSWPHQTFSG